MAWIPAMAAANRNGTCGRSSKKGVIIGLILSIVFGVLFFYFFNMRSFGMMISIPWMFISSISVFLIIIVVMAAAAANLSSPKNPYSKGKKKYYQGEYHQSQYQKLNPYKIQKSSQNQISISITDGYKEGSSNQEFETHFCGYCGAKIERDAIFCHLCGSKL
ncbi:hypothetical protein LCGC14_1554860 [marine sediment metagenome]|uniref:Zinc-ribbon domain-containing protein n=1 Tax=marine sediment metagenome TaxID=412755 RepID=A0A0F9JA86_9ZZZZ